MCYNYSSKGLLKPANTTVNFLIILAYPLTFTVLGMLLANSKPCLVCNGLLFNCQEVTQNTKIQCDLLYFHYITKHT